MIHVIALSVGFNILAVVFEFPDVLRQTAEYRLSLFAAAISLLKTSDESRAGILVGWKTALSSALAWIVLVIPAYAG